MSERAALLLAFKKESEILTRREIMARAAVDNLHQFQTILVMKLVEPTEWHPNYPREYRLTDLGKDRREFYNVAENLTWG